MKRRAGIIIGIISFIVGFAVAILVLISAVPAAFSSCGRKGTTVGSGYTYIYVEIMNTDGEIVHTCGGTEYSIELQADTDYIMLISSESRIYLNQNGLMGKGNVLLKSEDVLLEYEEELLSVNELEQEKDYILKYSLRGKQCSGEKIELNYSAEIQSVLNAIRFTPCSFTVSFI